MRDIMKKLAVLFLCGVLSVGSLVGCGSAKNKTQTETSVTEKENYCDDDFIKAMKKGLETRWDLTDADEKKDGYDDIAVQSDEYKNMMLSYVQAEIDEVEKFKDKKFENSKLQEDAISYINLLNESKESCKYISVDYDKYAEQADDIYNRRITIIKDLIDNYGLKIDDKYKDIIDDFDTTMKMTQEDNANMEAVGNMTADLEMDSQTDEFGDTTATGVLENNTGYDFDDFEVHFTLYDENGVVVDTPVDYLQNFTNGTKAQVEFYTDKQFSTYEVYGQWYE